MRFSETTKYLSNYLTFGRILSRLNNSRWDRYLGMTAAMTQLPVPTATQVQIKSEKITPMTSGLPTASCLCRSPRPSAMQRSLHPARRDHLKQLPRSRGLQRRKSGTSRTRHIAGCSISRRDRYLGMMTAMTQVLSPL